MPKLIQISGQELSRAVQKLGFEFRSQRGSHMKFVKITDRGRQIIIIPNHKRLRKGTLGSILKEMNIGAETLKELLR